MHLWKHDVERLLGTEVRDVRPLGGGSLGEVARVRLEDGGDVVVKVGGAPEREARMLRAIEGRGVPVPAVVAVDAHALVLETRPDHGSLASAWGHLGEVLKSLHEPADESGPSDYGWEEDDAFGPVAIPNGPVGDWPTFWAERRLLPHAERLPIDVARRLERLAGEVAGHLPARPAPALLHGDLWTGNVLTHGSRVSALIDPACYRGDGEVDLAMLTLFGSPGTAFWEAYPTRPGWEERRAIYQLWPAIVHLLLFGGRYRSLVQRLLARLGC